MKKTKQQLEKENSELAAKSQEFSLEIDLLKSRLENYENEDAILESYPYVIQVENFSEEIEYVDLFSFNHSFYKPNFGVPEKVFIKNLMSSSGSYPQLCAEISQKPVKIGKWRFASNTQAQIKRTIQIIHANGDGREQSSPVNLAVFMDSYQQQPDIIDLTKISSLDGNATIRIPILPGAKLTITAFPIAIYSPISLLNKGDLIAPKKPVMLSGRNAAPVIIQSMGPAMVKERGELQSATGSGSKPLKKKKVSKPLSSKRMGAISRKHKSAAKKLTSKKKK